MEVVNLIESYSNSVTYYALFEYYAYQLAQLIATLDSFINATNPTDYSVTPESYTKYCDTAEVDDEERLNETVPRNLVWTPPSYSMIYK